MNDLASLLKWYFYEDEGFWRVWKLHYDKISKVPLNEKARLRRKLIKRFGNNKKWNWHAAMYCKNPFLSRIPSMKYEMRIPLEYGGASNDE